MLPVVAVVGAVVAAWFVTRWVGRGTPYPVALAALFDSRIVRRFSGVETLLDRAEVSAGMRVLDAGCGPGRVTIPLAHRVGHSGQVVALDVQQGMLDRVRRNASRAGLRNVKLVRAALGDDSRTLHDEPEFDRIFLVTVLGEIPDSAAALRSLHSALKPNGMLSVTEMIIDPDYVPRGRLRKLASDAGFTKAGEFGSALAFTINFRRD